MDCMKKNLQNCIRFLMFSFLLTGFSTTLNAQLTTGSGELLEESNPLSEQSIGMAALNPQYVITQSEVNNLIEMDKGLGCLYGGTSYYRYFNLPEDFGITQDFYVNSIEFGIQEMKKAYGLGELTINIYSAEVGAYPNVSTTLVGSASYNLIGTEKLKIIKLPLTALIPAGRAMVMSVSVPNGVRIWIGGNSYGQTAPSYVKVANCGIFDIVPYTNIGYPFSNLMFNVYGGDEPVEIFNVTTASNPSIGGTTIGDGPVLDGDTATIKATPAEGYIFEGWKENGTMISTKKIYSFTVTSNRHLVAKFKAEGSINDSFEITTSSFPAIGGSTTGGGTYEENKQITVKAIPGEDYVFVNWTVDGIIVSDKASYKFIVSQNRNLVANFAKKQFLITTVASPVAGGTTSGDGSYVIGTKANLKATVNSGYTFSGWFLGEELVATTLNYKHTVTGKAKLTAKFIKNPTYAITTKSLPTVGGTTTGAGTYPENTQITVKATPDQGYNFVNWTVSGVEVSDKASYKFTVTAKMTLVANFAKKEFSITTKSSPTAGGTTSGDGTYLYNTKATVTATPNPTYEFVNWTISGVEVSTSKTYRHTVTGSDKLVANFVKAGSTTKSNEKITVLGNNKNEVSVYPNPFVENLTVKVEEGSIKEIMIFDNSGRIIMTQKGNNLEHQQIDTKNLSKGVYLLKLITEDGTKTFKVIKK